MLPNSRRRLSLGPSALTKAESDAKASIAKTDAAMGIGAPLW